MDKKINKKETVWSPPDLHVSLLYGLLLLTTNVVDALQTAIWYHDGLISEANPIMDWALSISLDFFVVFKLSLATVGCMALVFGSRLYCWAWKALQLVTFCFLLLMIYQAIGHYLSVTS